MDKPSNIPKPIRVLFVFDHFEFSGAAKVALDIIRAASFEQECKIEASGFVCLSDATRGRCPTDRIAFANPGTSPEAPIWKKMLYGLRAIASCWRAARDVDVLVGVTSPAAFVAQCAAWLSGRPAVAWVHYDINAWRRELDQYARSGLAKQIEIFFYRTMIPWFQHVVFVSDACLQSMQLIVKRPPRHWVVIPNLFSPIGFAQIDRSPDLDRLAQMKASGERIFLFIGRLARQKRWEDVLVTIEILCGQGIALQLLIVGDGVESEQFEQRLATSPYGSRIHWIRHLANPAKAFQLADALLLTSLYEAWPVVILEAFHFGLPVIAYRCPTGPEIMLASGRGILCRETPEAMASAILDFLQMAEPERAAMLERAKEFLAGHKEAVVLPQWREFLTQSKD